MLDIKKGSLRCNYDKELKDLNSIFNWYISFRENESFVNPVKKCHFEQGHIKHIPKKRLDMSMVDHSLNQ